MSVGLDSNSNGHYAYMEYKIRTPTISGGDNPWVKIKYVGGTGPTADWAVYINGDPADADTYMSRSQPHNHAHYLLAGLENTAESGKLGSSGDHVWLTDMGKSTNGGDTWGGWQGGGLSYNVDTGPGDHCHGHWGDGEEGFTWKDYRNW